MGIHFTIGALFLIAGLSKSFAVGVSIESGGFALIGLSYLVRVIIYYTATPVTPRVHISETDLLIKTKLFGRTYRFNWINIRSIKYNSYEIILELKDGVKAISYKCNPEVSLDIKQSLREMANTKDIEVVGG